MKETKKGFTLIELVVVMAIIAILSTIIVGAILAARTAATQTQRTGAVRTVETALESRASKCSGMYYAATAVGSTNCPKLGAVNTGTALVIPAASPFTVSMTGLVAALKNDGYLSTTVEIDQDTNYVAAFPGNNTYTISALANDGTTKLYTAQR